MAGPYPWQLVDVPYDGRTAAVRYNNPGAQYPSQAASRFGMEGFGVIGGGHKIAKFPTEAHGAAANMDNFARNYSGMTIGEAVRKWRGGNGSLTVPAGFDPNEVIDASFLGDGERMTRFFDQMSRHEGRGSAGAISPETWQQGFAMYRGTAGAPQEPQGSPVAPVSPAPVRLASAQGDTAVLPMLAQMLGMAIPGMGTGASMAGGGSAGAGLGGSPMGGGQTPFSMGGGGGGGQGSMANPQGASDAMKAAQGGPDQSMFSSPSAPAQPINLQQLMATLSQRQKLGLGG